MGRKWAVRCVAVAIAAVAACFGGAGAIARTESRAAPEWRGAPGTQVRLELQLSGGDAGWCLETATTTVTAISDGRSRTCQLARVSAGAVYAETCASGGEEGAIVSVLARSQVASVSIEGGPHVPTASNPTLPDGLRAAALQRPAYEQRGFSRHCPVVVGYGARGEEISTQVSRETPLAAERPTTGWEHPGRPPRGPCRITATRLRLETVAWDGMVMTRIRTVRGLLGSAFLSCADTVYIRSEGHYITAAVLLDAAHPGSTPPPLPEMQPLAGHAGMFEAHCGEGTIVARRIPRAWAVATEETPEGLATPAALLEHLRVTIELPRGTR